MKIHHLRNATFVIETKTDVILIDPMLGKKGSQPTFTYFRFKAQKNPIVELPECSKEILDKVTHCVITHKHPDHLDTVAEQYLVDKNIPVLCSIRDDKQFSSKGLNITQSIDYWQKTDFLGGTITGIPARHGYGFIAKPMGNVMGFFIELPDNPSIYISSDTIYTDAVDKVLREYKPDLSIVASGTAQLDIWQPLLMRIDDIVKFVRNAPGIVLANHLEAVNHCPTTRTALRKRLEKEGLSNKVLIPNDGDVLEVL